jgi:hypothetical protein
MHKLVLHSDARAGTLAYQERECSRLGSVTDQEYMKSQDHAEKPDRHAV